MMQHILDAASTGALYAMISLGIALVFGVMHLINFAYGELIMVGAYVALITISLPWPLTILCIVGTVGIVSMLMERVAFRPVRDADPTTMLITSFAVSILLQNIVVMLAGRRAKGIPFASGLTEPVNIFGASVPLIEPITIATIVAALICFVYMMKRTDLGMQMRASAEDFQMARLLGVKANSVIVAAFLASGLLAGIASILMVATTGTASPYMGLQPVLVGFVATVLGGMSSLVGAALGGFVLGVVTVGLQIALPDTMVSYRDAFVFTAVILALLVRPQGLFVRGTQQERV